MDLLSINTGRARPFDNSVGRTGIDKRPRSGPVEIHALGVEGDDVCDLKNHAGPDQAVYLYFQPDYDWWAIELGRPLDPGRFGENLTISGIASADILIGDRFEIGDVLLEVTSPRIPCATFAAHMGDSQWVKRFHAANRPGAYVRVLTPGRVEAGMAVRHTPFAGERVPLTALMTDYKNPAPERMRWLMQAPIHRELVEKYQARLRDA